jgi:hypothetical protein
MYAVVGPVRTKAQGYAFDVWTPEAGLRPGFPYPRVQDAYYARRVEIRQYNGEAPALVCNTIDEFDSKIAAAGTGNA